MKEGSKEGDRAVMKTKKRSSEKLAQKKLGNWKYRGVTRHKWTGRYEAHLWDSSYRKQVYLGGYDSKERAATAYDLAALKFRGPSTYTNFPLENYRDEMEEMKKMSEEEYVAHLRRKSSGFSRGASMYRGVTRHYDRWQARIGKIVGNKDIYLGTFKTQEEAAEAYDIAAIELRGVNAVTNFDITKYDAESIIAAGELAKRNKERQPSPSTIQSQQMVLYQSPVP